MNGTRHREVGEYLRRLQRSMDDLPAERRDEIVEEIEEHIAELLAANPAATDADVRNVLERVGDPEDIADEARERLEISPAGRIRRPKGSWTDIAAVTLLVLGGGSLMIVPFYRPEATVVAWGAATVLLWLSGVWSVRDKLWVTLVVPPAAFFAIALNGAGDPEGFIYFAVILFASIWAPVHLGLALRRARVASWTENALVGASGGTVERGRARWLIGGVLALAVIGVAVIALLALADGGEEGTHRDVPLITEAQFDRVTLGDSKEQVLQTLGGPGDAGSLVSGLDPLAREVPQDVGELQFDDCWSYQLTGSGVGPGSDAGICFDSSDDVVYTRLRIA